MGNQNTSGILVADEVKGANEVAEKSHDHVGSTTPDEVGEERQTQIQENETDDHEDVSEDHKGSVSEECTEMESNETNLKEGRSMMFNNEEQDQLCVGKEHSTEKMENPNPECTSTATILNQTPHEVASELDQEDQTMLEKEIVEIDNDDVEKKEVDLAAADAASVNAELSETGPDHNKKDDHQEEDQRIESSDEKQNECLAVLEENPLHDHEIIKELLTDQMIKSDIKENGEEYEVEIIGLLEERDHELMIHEEEIKDTNEVREVESIQMEGHIALVDENVLGEAVVKEAESTDNQESEELGDERVVEEAVLMEDESIKKQENEEQEDGSVVQSREQLEVESNPRYVGVEGEMRKSPSFDFGLSFDARSEESDQTPLLYMDKTPRRSFSSCSNLRFQSRSVQTEYLAKYEAVEVEEKTIRMERSNSESSSMLPKQDNLASENTKQETGRLKASQSTDDVSSNAQRGNAKRKPRSSLFTTCICCTAAIS